MCVKYYIMVLLFLVSGFVTITAQEKVLSFIQDDETSFSRKKEGFSFSNKITGDVAIVFLDRKTVYATLFNSEFKKTAAATGEVLKNKYNDLLGYRIDGNSYQFLAANSGMKKFAIQRIDFDTKTVSTKELDASLGKEKFIETVHYQNDLFIITATKDNEFIVRKLNDNYGFEEVKRFDIEAEARDQRLLNSGFFRVGLFGKATSNTTKVDNRVPNAIERTANPNKFYLVDNTIYLTIESEEELLTTLHTINLDTYSLKTKTYPYPKGMKDDFKKHNSFILEDKLIQLGSSRQEMKLVIKNLDDTVIKEFYLEKDKPIHIKNSPIIQDGATFVPFVTKREMEETSKYLRKISSGNIGVTAYKDGDSYLFTIGGYKMVNNGGGGMMMMPGAPTPVSIGGGTVFVPTYNPTFYSYNTYSTTKSTYFNTTLDRTFNYVEKEMEATIFERIKEFKKEFKYITAEDVFFHQGVLYFGFYDTKQKQYSLYKM